MKNHALLRLKTVVCLGIAAGIGVHSTPPALADAPAGHYVVTAGTVYDTKTKLTWQLVVSSSRFAHADAKAYCASGALTSSLGGTGWRLPTIKELYTLVDLSQPAPPAIDPVFARDLPGTSFWSSTLRPGSTTAAFSVGFNYGVVANPDDAPPTNYARCVR
jgi:hypothetical protein